VTDHLDSILAPATTGYGSGSRRGIVADRTAIPALKARSGLFTPREAGRVTKSSALHARDATASNIGAHASTTP